MNIWALRRFPLRLSGGRELSLVVLLFLLTFLLVLFFWFQSVLNRPLDAFVGVEVVVKKGETAGDFVKRLKSLGLVPSSLPVVIYLRLKGWDRRIRPAAVKVERDDTVATLIERVVFYHERPVRVVVSEGMDLFDIAWRLDRLGITNGTAFLDFALSPDAASRFGLWGSTLEGYLFPDTYLLPRNLTPERVAAVMVGNFKRKALPLLEGASLLSPYQTLIVASLIQRETYNAEEMPYIASVIYNRLKRGMPLQIDSTVIYAYRVKHRKREIFVPRPVHLRVDSPYNTYRVRGLPPTPICNPGLDAIKAALHPAETGYLYFVSKGDGTHYFSKTLREHNRAVRRFLR